MAHAKIRASPSDRLISPPKSLSLDAVLIYDRPSVTLSCGVANLQRISCSRIFSIRLHRNSSSDQNTREGWEKLHAALPIFFPIYICTPSSYRSDIHANPGSICQLARSRTANNFFARSTTRSAPHLRPRKSLESSKRIVTGWQGPESAEPWSANRELAVWGKDLPETSLPRGL